MKKGKTLLTIICPVYNEENVIVPFYKELNKVLLQCKNYQSEIIFILDKSEDKTFEKLDDLAKKNKNIKVIELSKRFGHQASLLAGIDAVKSEIAIMMDSDLQHPPHLIPEMLKKYEDGFEIVFTSRLTDKDKSFLRDFSSKFFYKVFNYFSGLNLENGETNFRLISKKVIAVFQEKLRETDPFLSGLFFWVGFRKTSVKYNASPRVAGKSKYNLISLISLAISSILSFSYKPLRLSIIFGLIIFIISLIFIMFILYSYFLYNNFPLGWPTLAVLITFFGGIQMIFIGIIGEYIGRIHNQIKNRPLYIIDRKINLD